MHGQGVLFLEHSLNLLSLQTFKDFNIVISDHSQSNGIKNLCKKWSDRLNIFYFKNTYKIGNSSANLNNALNKCTGTWIKILFQDDFLRDRNSLDYIAAAIRKSSKLWYVTACDHSNDGKTMYRPFYPKWNSEMYLGNNTFSSPSVLTLKNTLNKYLFDENMIWLMDVDYYQRMYNSYGAPGYVNNICVVNRTWANSLSNTISQDTKNNELTLSIKKQKNMSKVETIFNKLCNLEYPEHFLHSRGIVDINEHLPLLRNYASECEHVTELGTRFAISTLGFLIGKPKKVTTIDINYHFYKPFKEEVERFAKECNVEFQFIEGDVLKIDINETDLLFIDTLHTYNQLSRELKKHKDKVRKWIILHDTTTFGYTDEEFYKNGNISEEIAAQEITKRGLAPALEEFLMQNKEWTVKEVFTNNNGLTVLQKNASN